MYGADDVFNKCFDYDNGSYTFMLLTLLYPEIQVDAAVFHQDHVHPYAGFENKNIKGKGFSKETIERRRWMGSKLPNLELLQGQVNESKNDLTLADWIKRGNRVKFMPDGASAELKDFDTLFEKRNELMAAELKRTLGYVTPSTTEPKTEGEDNGVTGS